MGWAIILNDSYMKTKEDKRSQDKNDKERKHEAR